MERRRPAALPGRRLARRRRRHRRRTCRPDGHRGTRGPTRRRAARSPRRCGRPATGRPSRRRSTSAGASVGRPRRGEHLRRADRRRACEQRLGDFADLVAQALANADAYEKLAASRARLVEVGDAERQRLERNLHDGAQQRLVSVALAAEHGRREARPATPTAARELLAAAQADLARGLDELRELARGIHPAMLTERGLGAALDALAARAPLPVEVTALPSERFAAPVEAAAYYVVAEAITNVAKYAHASSATVSVGRSNGTATRDDRRDDGIGGADPAGGSGLRGLAARVEALNGRLDVDSPPGGGTRITAEIPAGRGISPASAGVSRLQAQTHSVCARPPEEQRHEHRHDACRSRAQRTPDVRGAADRAGRRRLRGSPQGLQRDDRPTAGADRALRRRGRRRAGRGLRAARTICRSPSAAAATTAPAWAPATTGS